MLENILNSLAMEQPARNILKKTSNTPSSYLLDQTSFCARGILKVGQPCETEKMTFLLLDRYIRPLSFVNISALAKISANAEKSLGGR